MNSKERVVKALTRNGLPARVPVQFDFVVVSARLPSG